MRESLYGEGVKTKTKDKALILLVHIKLFIRHRNCCIPFALRRIFQKFVDAG